MPTDIHPSVFSLFVHVSAVKNNMALVHVSLVACVGEEQKTKPTQHRLDARLNNCRQNSSHHSCDCSHLLTHHWEVRRRYLPTG